MMKQKLSFLIVLVLFVFLLVNTPLLCQESKTEDIADISIDELLNVELTTAGKKAEKISDIPASVVLITRSDIEKYGYHTLNDVLKNVPGLFPIDQRDVAGMNWGVRGFWTATANNLIILINGVRQERMESDGAVYSSQYVPVEAIDRIEVIRGPMSVIYGPGAFFGAINIITNEAKNQKDSMVALSGGLEETYRIAVRAAHKKNDLSLAFNAGLYSSDGPDIPHTRMSSFDLSEYTPFTSTKGLWSRENKYINLSGTYKGFYVNITHDQDDRGWYLLYLPTAKDGSNSRRQYSTFSFGYSVELSKKFSLDGKFSYRRGTTHGNFGWFVPPNSVSIGNDHNDREDYEVDLTTYYKASEKINLTAGLYYKKRMEEQLAGEYPFQDLWYRLGLYDPIQSRALFAQADITPVKAVRLVLGLRLEQTLEYSVFFRDNMAGSVGNDATFKYDKVEAIPRIAALFYLNEKNIVKLLYGKAINIPNFYQVVAEATSNQPPLAPEFITTFEANYLAAVSDKFNLNTSIFYNKFDGLIVNTPVYDPISGIWTSGYNTNSGKLETLGGELTLLIIPAAGLKLELSGTLQKTKDKRPLYENIEVPNSPKVLGYLKAAYSFGKNAVFSVTGRYVGSMEALWDYTIVNPDGTHGNRIANKVDGYFVFGASLRIDNIFGKGYYFNISGSNLLDRKYLYPTYTLNSYWANLGLAGDPIMVMVTIGKKF